MRYIILSLTLTIAALACLPMASAQTNLYEEIVIQTDTVQLLYSNSRRLLANRLSIKLFDDLLEIVDLAEQKINNLIQQDTVKYIQTHVTITNQQAKLAFCLLNGNYDRFFDMLEHFTSEWSPDRLQNWAEYHIANDPQKWLQWADTHPMTDTQRLAAKSYLYYVGVDKNTDKAHYNCTRLRKQLAGSEYVTFAKYAESETASMTLDLAIGATPMLLYGTLADFAGSSLHWAGYFEMSFHVNRSIFGLCGTILTTDYIGEPLSVVNKHGSFAVQTGTSMNFHQTVAFVGYKISMPRRINCYGIGEVGIGSVSVPSIKTTKTEALDALPMHLVFGAALRTEIGLKEWKNPNALLGFKLLINVGARVTPRYGSTLLGTAALVCYFGG